MAFVRTEALKTGLRLARDVQNSQGQLLLRSGTIIQDRHLMLLTSWGVVEVEVQDPEGAAQTPAEVGRTRRLTEIKEGLREKFRHNNSEAPVMMDLLELCAQRKAKLLK